MPILTISEHIGHSRLQNDLGLGCVEWAIPAI